MSSSDAATAATLLGVGARTRAQKRRRGDERTSSLWDVIVKCDDITFTHILPRLNRTDVKFLHGVNSETRKLIKRSSRKKELKEKFKVEEMSSISTLEVAWEHFPWEAYDYDAEEEMDETYSAGKLLKRINSSCSSGRERRKSVSGTKGRLMRPHLKVIWKW